MYINRENQMRKKISFASYPERKEKERGMNGGKRGEKKMIIWMLGKEKKKRLRKCK